MPDNTISDYELGEPVGQSEYFVTYKARHVRLRDRYRAIKLPQLGTSGRTRPLTLGPLKSLFLYMCDTAVRVAQACDAAEGDAAAAKRIASIETIHFDADVEIDAYPPNPEVRTVRPYIVTEWSAGGSLADRLIKGPLPEAQCVEIVIGVLEGLQLLHSRDIVHGNLKPGNILLGPDDAPRITDAGGNYPDASTPVRRGAVPYLSPEQLEQTKEGARPIDIRCDLYSLTLVLYEMLTGKRLGRALTAAQMPSMLNPIVGSGFDDLILQGLQADPTQRFESALAMTECIRRIAFGTPTPDVPIVSIPIEVPTPSEKLNTELLDEIDLPGVVEVREPQIEPEMEIEPEPAPPAVVRMAGEVRMNPRDEAAMVWASSGVLSMGGEDKDDEQPIHDVQIKGFWIYRFPVTQSLYRSFMTKLNANDAPGEVATVRRPGMYKPGTENANKPVAGVTWSDAAKYARWVGGRLPTEAEWEWAARGEVSSRYPWGDEWEEKRANISEGDLTDVTAHPAGASWCGAIDLLGNAMEWSSSLYRPYPYDAADGREDPNADGKRVSRGGSAATPQQHVYSACRVDPSRITGFRVVLDEE